MKQRYFIFIALSFFIICHIHAQCELTYEQGYLKGHELGVTENYEHENMESLKVLIKKHKQCPEYTRGLEEAYEAYKYSGISTCANAPKLLDHNRWKYHQGRSPFLNAEINFADQSYRVT